MKRIACTVVLCLLWAGAAQAIDYTWTGAAGDGNWTNTANWDANGVPVDNYTSGDNNAGLNMHYTDSVVFDGANLPSTNFPGIGGYWPNNKDTPTMLFNSGGTTTFDVVAGLGGLWTDVSGYRTVWTVGDGVGGGVEDVTLNITGLTGPIMRHADGTHNILVNSDGMLNFATGIDFSYNDVRWTTFTIAGGHVSVNGAVTDLDNYASNVVSFTEAGGSFTAAYGSDFGNIGVVRGRLGIDFLNNTGDGHYLRAISNGGSSFTVMDGLRWTGAAGDQDWNNTTNWVDGRVPVDNQTGTGEDEGLTRPYWDVIEFGGANLPTNAPGLGGKAVANKDTPSMVFNSGGSVSLAVVGRDNDIWTNAGGLNRTIFTVGNGVGGGVEDVTLNLTMADDLMRHANSHHHFVVNSDGTFNITASATLKFAWGATAARTSSFTIAGGTVVINKPLVHLSRADCFVEFTEPGGSFTAQYGSDFADIAAVRNSLGVDFLDNTGLPSSCFRAIDGGSAFTVVLQGTAATVLLVR